MQLHEPLLSSDADRSLLDARTQRACVEACFDAEVACVVCADACLAEDDLDELRRCIRMNLDCAEIAGVTGRLLARTLTDPRLLRAQIEACARACAACAAECQHHASEHEHCHASAEACHRAADHCGSVLRELPDAHGQTHPKARAAP